MEVSNVIAILLFILPGMISEKVSHMLDYPNEKEPSDFIKTVNGILISLPIVFINSVCFAIFNKVNSLKEFIKLFDNIIFLGIFIISILITSVYLGYKSAKTKESRLNKINSIRKNFGKLEVNSGSCWKQFTIERKAKRYLEVIINDQSYKGFAGDYSTPDESMSIILETDKEFYLYDDFEPEKFFTKVIGTYIDIEKNVVIKDYDMSEFNEWYSIKEDEIKATS